jgi:hypothetical protein
VNSKLERTWKKAVMVKLEVLSVILLEELRKTSADVHCITLLQRTIDNLNLYGIRALSHVLILPLLVSHFFIHFCITSIIVGSSILDCSVV